jgi:GcrA cell cycle regulator
MSGWTPERCTLLAKLWEQGFSASQVAKQLGGVSRNAVIGKVHREGLTLRGRAQPSPPAPRVPKPPKVPRATVTASGVLRRLAAGQPKARAMVPALDPIDASSAKPWTERGHGECAYPINGDGADTLSCCLPTEATYCAGHAAQMYAAQKPSSGLRRPNFKNTNRLKQRVA